MYSSMSRVQGRIAKLRHIYLSLTRVFAALLIRPAGVQPVPLVRSSLFCSARGGRRGDSCLRCARVAAPFSFLSHLSGVISEVTAD